MSLQVVLKDRFQSLVPTLSKWGGTTVGLTLCAIGALGLYEAIVEQQSSPELAVAGTQQLRALAVIFPSMQKLATLCVAQLSGVVKHTHSARNKLQTAAVLCWQKAYDTVRYKHIQLAAMSSLACVCFNTISLEHFDVGGSDTRSPLESHDVGVGAGAEVLNHSHAPEPTPQDKRDFGMATFVTGVLYGLQPDALFVIIPALTLPTKLAAACYLFSFVIGTVTAMGSYTAFIGANLFGPLVS